MSEAAASPPRRGDPTGSSGLLRLRLARRDGRTIVADQYWRLPLQVMPPSWEDGDDQAFVYLLNPTGGIVRGDRLRSEVVLEPGARGLFTTQSATRVYRADGLPAEEWNRFVVGRGAVLEVMPDQTIPFAGAAFRRTTRLDLDPSSTAVLTEVLIAGRLARGERFGFARLRLDTEILVGSARRLVDRLDLDPSRGGLDRLGLWDGHAGYGALYAYSPALDGGLAARVADVMEGRDGVNGGAGQPGPGLLVARALGPSAEALQGILFDAWDVLRRALLAKPARRLRKY